LDSYIKIRKELSKYSSNLIKKKEIIVFNKTDIINKKDIEEKIDLFKKKIKKNVFKISVAQSKGLVAIKKILINNVHK
jgi:GTP-binding protein